MDALFKLAEFYVLQRVIGPYAPFNSLGKAKIFLGIFIVLFSLIGLGFTLVGYYMWLHSEIAAPEAKMIFGATMLVLTIVMIGMISYIQTIREKRQARAREQMKSEITDLLYLVDRKLSENNPVKNHPTASVITSALCGYMAGERVQA